MPLARSTMNNYRSMLKRLRRVLPLLAEDHPQRPKVVREVERLTNLLGLEMTQDELEAWLARGPGRTPGGGDKPDVASLENEVAETPEAKAARVQRELVERYKTTYGEDEFTKGLRESAALLEEMKTTVGGDTDVRESNADEPGGVGETDRERDSE